MSKHTEIKTFFSTMMVRLLGDILVILNWYTTIIRKSWIQQILHTIWNLAKWARRVPEEKRRPPQITDIVDASGNLIIQNIDKAKAMGENFFPLPIRDDLEDIKRVFLPWDTRTKSKFIKEIKIEENIRKIPQDKAPGTDWISNWFFR